MNRRSGAIQGLPISPGFRVEKLWPYLCPSGEGASVHSPNLVPNSIALRAIFPREGIGMATIFRPRN